MGEWILKSGFFRMERARTFFGWPNWVVGGEASDYTPQSVCSATRAQRDVAQPGSAPEWGSGGRGFKSRRPDFAPARSGAKYGRRGFANASRFARGLLTN